MCVGMVLAGCDSASNADSRGVDGKWTANLANPDGSPAFAFSTNFADASKGSFAITHLTFSSAALCFASQTTAQAASTDVAGSLNGHIAGTFAMTISTSSLTPNTLHLQGGMIGNTITGTWKLTGAPGCAGNGTFTLNKSELNDSQENES